MINRIAIVTKFIDVLKKFFKKMMFRNTVENISFDKEERQISDLLSFTFATFVSIFIVSFLNQFLNLKLLKLIKTLKNEKKQKDRKRRAKNDINTIYLRKKFKDSLKLFSTFKNVVVDVVISSSSITLLIIDEIINEFVA